MKMSVSMRVVTSVVLTLLFVGVARAQQDPRELFERARFLDENNTNLGDAIALYTQVAEADAQRRLSAEAHLRIGLLYERLGRRSEARDVFETVVQDYSDQTSVVRRAEMQMASHQPISDGLSGIVLRQVWAGEEVDILGAPSRDGRYLSFVDWSTGDLAVRDLETEENRRLTDKGSWTQSVEYAERSTISPDGRRVAFTWFDPKTGMHDLRLSMMDGSQQRVLFRDDEVPYVQPEGWSSDGAEILTLITTRDKTSQIALIAVEDGSKRILKSLGWQVPGKLSLSPDGKHIAYDLPTADGGSSRDIYVLPIDGQTEIPVVEHPANDHFPIWSMEGRTLLFISDRTGTADVWALDIANGRPEGVPVLVKRNVGRRVLPMGMTRDGSLFYGLLTGMSDVYTATLDLSTGKLLSQPTKVAPRFEGSHQSPEWSPDGNELAMVRSISPIPFGEGPSVINIRSVDEDVEQEISTDLKRLGYYSAIRWSPDGGSFLVVSEDGQNRPGIYGIDAENGEVTTILHTPPRSHVSDAAWFPDGEAILLWRVDHNTEQHEVVKRDLVTGGEDMIYETDSPSVFIRYTALSPNGDRVAFVEEDHSDQSRVLKVVSVRTDEITNLSTPEDEFIVHDTGLTWTPDGRNILFATYAEEGKRVLWKIAPDGGDAVRLDLAMEGLGGVRFHPDGKQVAFVAGSYSAEVWAMENFMGIEPEPIER